MEVYVDGKLPDAPNKSYSPIPVSECRKLQVLNVPSFSWSPSQLQYLGYRLESLHTLNLDLFASGTSFGTSISCYDLHLKSLINLRCSVGATWDIHQLLTSIPTLEHVEFKIMGTGAAAKCVNERGTPVVEVLRSSPLHATSIDGKLASSNVSTLMIEPRDDVCLVGDATVVALFEMVHFAKLHLLKLNRCSLLGPSKLLANMCQGLIGLHVDFTGCELHSIPAAPTYSSSSSSSSPSAPPATQSIM